MPDDNDVGLQWVVEPPPAPGEVALYMVCGEGVELTEEQEAALGALLRSLEAGDAEVIGHSPECPSYFQCKLECGKVKCGTLECTLNKAAALGGAQSWNLMGSFTQGLT